MAPRADRAATWALALARGVWRLLPAGAKRGVEERFFYAVFQRTRVENDAYGWRPPPPGGTPPAPTEPPR